MTVTRVDLANYVPALKQGVAGIKGYHIDDAEITDAKMATLGPPIR